MAERARRDHSRDNYSGFTGEANWGPAWQRFKRQYGSGGREAWDAFRREWDSNKQQYTSQAKARAEKRRNAAGEARKRVAFDEAWQMRHGDQWTSYFLRRTGIKKEKPAPPPNSRRTEGPQGFTIVSETDLPPDLAPDLAPVQSERSPTSKLAEFVAYSATRKAVEYASENWGNPGQRILQGYERITGAMYKHWPDTTEKLLSSDAFATIATAQMRVADSVAHGANYLWRKTQGFLALEVPLVTLLPENLPEIAMGTSTAITGRLTAGAWKIAGHAQNGVEGAMNFIRGLRLNRPEIPSQGPKKAPPAPHGARMRTAQAGA